MNNSNSIRLEGKKVKAGVLLKGDVAVRYRLLRELCVLTTSSSIQIRSVNAEPEALRVVPVARVISIA